LAVLGELLEAGKRTVRSSGRPEERIPVEVSSCSHIPTDPALTFPARRAHTQVQNSEG
jgi:hypothetical protein